MTPTRLLIVDDHHLFRQGLRTVLAAEEDFAVLGEASTAREAFALFDELAPEVVSVDVTLPDGDGIGVTREMLRRQAGTRVLALTMHASHYYVSQALAAGAKGYALKDQRPPEILDALRTVARGEIYVAPQLPQDLAQCGASAGAGGGDRGTGPLAALSPRERAVFDLVVRGYTNFAAAEALQLSVKTVETHRAHINRKLRVHSTGELIRLAALHGLVTV
jgi:two-component system, NarL family, response regulator NreC